MIYEESRGILRTFFLTSKTESQLLHNSAHPAHSSFRFRFRRYFFNFHLMVRVRFLHANPDPKAIMRSCPIFASSSSRSSNFWQLWVSLFWGLQLRFLLWQLLQINQFARKKNVLHNLVIFFPNRKAKM